MKKLENIQKLQIYDFPNYVLKFSRLLQFENFEYIENYEFETVIRCDLILKIWNENWKCCDPIL